MKILNVSFTTRLGGLEQTFLDYNNVLKLHSHEVRSVIHTGSKIILPKDDIIYRIWSFSKYDPLALFVLKTLVREVLPDLIITHGNRAHYMMQRVAGRASVIGVAHGYGFDHIKNCDYIISVSQHIMQSIIDIGYSEDRILHIPNMVKIPENLQFIEPKFKEVPVIGMIARFEKIKGIDIFVKAMDLLKQKKIPFKAVIAGDGVERNNIKTLIKELNLEDDIEILGWVEDKAKFYNNVDILCIPSLEESFGIVILEAFMYSKPTIVSALPGPLEIVTPNQDAITFQVGNITELAEKIVYLLSNPELVQTMAEKGFNRVKSYSIEPVGNRLAALVSHLS
jgi:glycosyltransferase involved in cell wall biosynthesis